MSKSKFILVMLFFSFFSGAFSIGRIVGIDFDIEIKYLFALMFIFSLFIVHNYGISHKVRDNKLLIMFLLITKLLIFILSISIFFSDNLVVSIEKFVDIIFLSVLLIGLTFVISNYKSDDFFKLLTGFIIILGLFYLLPVYISILSGDSRGRFLLGGHNVTTRILFFSACCSIYRFSISRKIVYFILGVLFIIGIVFVGSRGGLIGAGLTLSLLCIIKLFSQKISLESLFRVRYKLSFYLILGSFFIWSLYEPLQRVFQSRVINLMFNRGDKGIHTAGRDSLYEHSINMIKEKPIMGYGLNGFAVDWGRSYPHNLVLELMIEIGVLGLIFFLIIMFYSLYLILKLRNTKLLILSGLPLYMVIVQMFSGGFYDFRYFFFWSILLLYYGFNNELNKASKLNTIDKGL
ncbi:O-antigen ligase family protein [Alkalihalobacillus sp. 1P02AB]|uniref:O-antigen ligase family protein n=1 Tax=Alkalihalobacillus sp. 1P02AB TaxID=3132260 RepID=UPI0039A50FA8